MFRVITLIALLLTLPNLSGLGATALALARTGGVEACCDGGGASGSPPGFPVDLSADHAPDPNDSPELDRDKACYGPSCPCLFCGADDLTPPSTPGLPPAPAECAPAPLHARYPSDFKSSIEYPPEAA